MRFYMGGDKEQLLQGSKIKLVSVTVELGVECNLT